MNKSQLKTETKEMDNIIRVGDRVRRSYHKPETFELVVLDDEYTVTKIEEYEGFYGPTTRYYTEGDKTIFSTMTCTKVATIK